MDKDLVRRFVERILAADRRGATALVDEWAAVHGYLRAVEEIIDPAVAMLGEKWARPGEVSLAQGYVAGQVVEMVMTRAAECQKDATEESGSRGVVVIGCTEDDYHPLGCRLVGVFLKTAGWEVHNLGTDVLAGEFVDKAEETGACVIGVSAMMYSTAENILKLRQEIDARGLKGRLQLAVGGAVFVLRPELVGEVGGDGTARNATLAPALVDDLWTRSLSVEAEA